MRGYGLAWLKPVRPSRGNHQEGVTAIDEGTVGHRDFLRRMAARATGTAWAACLAPAQDTGLAYERSHKNIRKLLPLAGEFGVTIAVENVWNKFLLSPVESAHYVDEFDSRRLRAYLDVGNMILFGYAQDWIRTVGTRIVRIHLKDFKREASRPMTVLDGDEGYLTDLARRIDRIISLQAASHQKNLANPVICA